jgi:hypothetical protein
MIFDYNKGSNSSVCDFINLWQLVVCYGYKKVEIVGWAAGTWPEKRGLRHAVYLRRNIRLVYNVQFIVGILNCVSNSQFLITNNK